MLKLLAVFSVSLFVVVLGIPRLILIAYKKRLFDAPTETRKIHKKITPNLGGLAIFTALLFTLALFSDTSLVAYSNALLASGIILFVAGLKDDLIGVDPMKKFVAQFLAAFIIAILGDIRIQSLHGVLGVYALSYPFSIALTVFFIVGVVNAYNLIDGIDGLAGSLGLIASITFGVLFYAAGDMGWTILSIALAGGLSGFLLYNISPARIFMGDTGSLMIGFIAAVSAVHLLNLAGENVIQLGFIRITSAPPLLLSILIVPIFDTIRVFAIRIVTNTSPFAADRNHLHHRLLNIGLNHNQATCCLSLLTIVAIATSAFLQPIGSNQLLGMIVLILIVVNFGFTLYVYSKNAVNKRKPAEVNSESEPNTKGSKNFVESVLQKIIED